MNYQILHVKQPDVVSSVRPETKPLIRTGKEIRPNFLHSTSLLCKILPTNLYLSNLYFLYITSKVKQYYLSYRRQTIFRVKLHSVSIQDNQSWAFSKTVQKKFPKSPIQLAGSHFWQSPNLQCLLWWSVWMNIERVTLQHNKEFKKKLCLFFYLMVITMCNLKKWLIRVQHFEYSFKRCSWTTENTAQWLDLQERLPTINKRNIIRWNIYRDNNFHSQGQVWKCVLKSWVGFKLKA